MASMSAPLPPFEVLPRDLSAYRAGNTGIDYVHRFESGRPGPHVMVNALTHGNEFCGMVAVCHLLDSGVRPKIGTLTLSFANVAAYETFDTGKPFDSRLITHNLNRIWSPAWLDGGEDSVELRRAREMRPAVAAADHILDIHSTSQDVGAVLGLSGVRAQRRGGARAAAAGGAPGHAGRPRLGHAADPARRARAGRRRRAPRSSSNAASTSSRRAPTSRSRWRTNFLAHFGLIDRPVPRAATPPRRFELLRTHVIQHESFAFARPVIGFETFAEGELIATDGALEIRAPCDDCTIFMPARQAIVGREGVYLTKPIPS